MSTATARKPRLTLVEQELILQETVRLLKEPASWTTGAWKCELWAVDKKGDVIHDGDGEPVRACDHNNRPLSQYCIEGGLNQATYNVLGKDRAVKLGAVKEYGDPETENVVFESDEGSLDPAELLGINKLAMELYADRIREERGDYEGGETWYDEDDAALTLNDSYNRDDKSGEGHMVILGLVKTRLGQVRDELDARSA